MEQTNFPAVTSSSLEDIVLIGGGGGGDSASDSGNGKRCDSWWDGIYQWPETSSNTTISIPCHKIFALTMGQIDADDYEKQTLYAKRHCGTNGQWGWNNWTNYTECLNLLALQEKDTSTSNIIQGIVSYIVLVLLIVSMVSLIISIAIFISFKPLKCLRIRVHKNLCIALLMNCSLYIIMNSLVGIHKLDLSAIADWFCKSLKSLNIYSSMATINWMFVEGFLFHKTLSSPFHQNTRCYLLFYYFIGWIFPAIVVITWSLSVEFFSEVSKSPCWKGYGNSNTIFIVSVPMIICVAINFLFLINIIRILMTKLRADHKSDSATIKAIKATALLIPLLGIHHLVVLYNPSTFNRKLVDIYIVINVMFQSIQGIMVSVLYCFTNQEVRTVLNSAWSRRRMSLNPLAGSGGGGLAVNLNANNGGGHNRNGAGGANDKRRRQSNQSINNNNNESSLTEQNRNENRQFRLPLESMIRSFNNNNNNNTVTSSESSSDSPLARRKMPIITIEHHYQNQDEDDYNLNNKSDDDDHHHLHSDNQTTITKNNVKHTDL